MLITKGPELAAPGSSCPLQEACPTAGCTQTGVQELAISQPVTLTPSVSLGTISVSCQGRPSMTCTASADGTSCTVTMTEQIAVSIPVDYSVELTPDAPTIACADRSCGC